MKTKILILLVICLLTSILNAQNFQDVIKEANDVSELDDICQSALGFLSTPEEVEKIVNEIVQTAGMKSSEIAGFRLKECNQIDNAIAKILKENGRDVRYVIYDPNWLLKYSDRTNNNWSGTFILAHEIGHHVLGHSLNSGTSQYNFELTADYFAGKALSQMGASSEAIEKALSGLPERASATHPSRADRISSAMEGWNSVLNKELTIVVKKEDIDQVGLNIMNNIKDRIQSNNIQSKEEVQKTLQALFLAKNKYYNGYTEEIRYYEAILYHKLDEKKSAVKSMIEYLSIQGLNNTTRINQIAEMYVKSDQEKIAYFTNNEVLFSLSRAFFNDKQYDNAISFGNQFLSRSEDNQKKSTINKLIADSEVEKIFSKDKNLSEAEIMDKADTFYLNGNYENAYEWYNKASLRKNYLASYKMGVMLLNGNGVTKDTSKALEIISNAAAFNQVDAQFLLGKLYYEGTKIEKNTSNALFWLKKSRENGETKAEKLITEIEKSLERINSSKEESRKEENKITLAQIISKANSYYDKKMYSEAYPLLLSAAEAGNSESQYRIGMLLYKGNGTQKSKNEAISWWRLAAKQGHVDSINILTRLGEW